MYDNLKRIEKLNEFLVGLTVWLKSDYEINVYINERYIDLTVYSSPFKLDIHLEGDSVFYQIVGSKRRSLSRPVISVDLCIQTYLSVITLWRSGNLEEVRKLLTEED